MRRATIISDASFVPHSKTSSWGAWVKADGKPSETYGGLIRRECNDSTDAEICALANALYKAISTGLVEPNTEVMLQSDSTQALGLLKKLVPNVSVRNHKDSAELAVFRKPQLCGGLRAEAAKVVERIATAHGLTIVLRHVRGHKAGGGRQWVNRKVDSIAKAARSATRDSAASGGMTGAAAPGATRRTTEEGT